jgi:hypothetical protein
MAIRSQAMKKLKNKTRLLLGMTLKVAFTLNIFSNQSKKMESLSKKVKPSI